MTGRFRAAVLVLAVGGTALIAGCAGGAPSSGMSGNLTVFAAASLTDAFSALGNTFHAAHPDVTVTFDFAGSQTLASQIVDGGAPADVFASANETQMQTVVDAGRARGNPRVFAGNRLAIAVEKGNPKGIEGLADLARPGLVLVLAAPEVPAGAYARQVLDRAGIVVHPASLERDVRAVLSKVALGEADAGIVYTTDVVALGGAVEAVAIPTEQNVVAAYPIVAIAGTRHPAAADAFVRFVTSAQGTETLDRFGFAPPESP